MEGSVGHWDEVESLLSLSDATIHSQSGDELEDIDSELAAVTAGENDQVVQEDEYHEEEEDEDSRPQDQSKTNENREIEIPEAKDSSRSPDKEVKTTSDDIISDKLDPMNNRESNLQTNGIDIPGEKSGGDEENQESDEEMLDGGTELPFVRSVKYLEKHEIFRLFQNLAAEIVYQRPHNPLQFIVNKLEKEKQESQGNSSEDRNPKEGSQPS